MSPEALPWWCRNSWYVERCYPGVICEAISLLSTSLSNIEYFNCFVLHLCQKRLSWWNAGGTENDLCKWIKEIFVTWSYDIVRTLLLVHGERILYWFIVSKEQWFCLPENGTMSWNPGRYRDCCPLIGDQKGSRFEERQIPFPQRYLVVSSMANNCSCSCLEIVQVGLKMARTSGYVPNLSPQHVLPWNLGWKSEVWAKICWHKQWAMSM